LSFATNAAIAAGDSVLAAFGKLQAQVTAAFSAIDSEVSTRTSEVSRLDGRVDTEILDRQSEISRVDDRIDTVTSELASEVYAAVSSVQSALDTEISDRTSDVQSVRDVTDNHEGRLTSAESTIAGLGTMSTQNANNVNITGGTITGVTLNAQSMEVGQGQTADLFVGNDGKVGIGTEAPTEKLTVNGNIDMLGGEIKNLAKVSTQDGLVVSISGDELTLKPWEITSNYGNSRLSFEECFLKLSDEVRFSWGGNGGSTYVPTADTDVVRMLELNTKADKAYTVDGGDVVYGSSVLWDNSEAVPSLVINDGDVQFYPDMSEAVRKSQQTNFSNALDLQKKLVVSDTAPEHIDGREWLDTTDFRRYISISGAWVENITA
jgi:hypothetical protein